MGMRLGNSINSLNVLKRWGVSVLAPSTRQDFSKVLAQQSQSRQKCAIATTQSLTRDRCELPRKLAAGILSIPAAAENYQLSTIDYLFISQRHGRGAGVGRGLGVGAGLGVGVALGVDV